jgi:hypothetical protein
MDALNVQRAVVLACWPSTDPLLAGMGADAALLEVAGKPMVQRVVEQVVALGARRIDVVLGDDATPYQDCLGDGERWGCTIAYRYAPSGACLPSSLARQLAEESDCLLTMADAMLPAGCPPRPASFGGPTMEGELTWSGWARLPGSALVAAAERVTSPRGLFLALSRNRQLHRCRDLAGPSAASAVALLDAAKSLLRAPDYPIGIARRPVAEGLWIGNGARIHPTARVIAPAWLGDHVLVAADAVVGPDAVIGARSVVDRGATVVSSLVAPGSYIGAEVELREALLSGRRLVNVAFGATLEIADRELAGPVGALGDAAGPRPAERLLASILWAASRPLARAAAGRLGGRRAPAQGDASADVVAAMHRGEPGAWVRHFREVMQPGLADVARGRRRIVGPLRRSPSTAAAEAVAPNSSMALAVPGLINDSLFLGPDGADPTLGFAADALAAGRQPFGHLFRAIVRYAKAVAKDWRSLQRPRAQAAPTLAQVPETPRNWSQP